MKNMKKSIIIFGAVAITFLMVSSVTAVPQVSSQPLVEQIEKTEQKEGIPIEDIIGLSDFTNFEADKENVLKLMGKLGNFLEINKLTESQYKTSDIYNRPEFQNFINRGNGIENGLGDLAYALSDIVDKHSGVWPEELLRETLVATAKDFFADLIGSTEYYDFKASVYDDTLMPLAEDLAKVYKGKDKAALTTTNNNDGKDVQTNDVSATGFVAEQLLIAFCTIVFLAHWIFWVVALGGIGDAIAEITEPIIGILLAMLITIPAVCILITDLVIGNVQAAFEALLVAIVTAAGFFADTLVEAIWAAGFVGLVVWALASPIILGLTGLDFFVTFIVSFFEYANYEIGYVANHLGDLVTEILKAAERNARDIYESIFGPGLGNPKQINKSRQSLLVQLFARIIEKISTLERMFSKHMMLLTKNIA